MNLTSRVNRSEGNEAHRNPATLLFRKRVHMSILTIATTTDGAGKTTLRLILGRSALSGGGEPWRCEAS
jgi:hypothetical protein